MVLGLPFIHSPYLLPVQRALAPLDCAEFWLRWSAIMACLFFASFLFLDHAFGGAGVSAPLRLMFVAVGVAFSPVVISLVQGQDTALLYLAVAVWLAAFAARRDFLAGLALSLASIRPHIALVVQAQRTSAHSGLWVIARLLGISHLISLATVPNFLGRDLLIVASYGVTLVILLRAGDRGAVAQGDSIGDRSNA